MIPEISLSKNIEKHDNLLVINPELKTLLNYGIEKKEGEAILKKLSSGSIHRLQTSASLSLFFSIKKEKEAFREAEYLRRKGYEVYQLLQLEKIPSLQISGPKEEVKNFLEGFLLSAYQFQKYKSKKKEYRLKEIMLLASFTKEDITELKNLINAVYITRDLVNEPAITLTAQEFSAQIKKLGKEAGFEVEVLNKKKIESLRMGGLIAVNQGSTEPPTFNILEYKPKKYTNKKPIVLVGKGVTYDTGGLSLKPSESMELMKCDMAGGAAVAGAIYAAAKNKLQLHIIGLIPATDNRPWEEAISPGDVITISDGTTVEVLNTDAEGRLILADALIYAKRYKPQLVIDLATLTGAALRAIGREGTVMMGTASEETKKDFIQTGLEVHERLVEFPLWEEYRKQIESDIADIKNLGGPEAGAITAGKFLEHFTDYPWLHLDIAGPAYLISPDSYRGKNGTGMGVRLLYAFLKKLEK